MKTALQRLTEWYSRQCNGEWEHGYGFTISTLDNPGVSVKIELRDTYLESIPFEEKKDSCETRDTWMICRRNADVFEGAGAASRLENIIEEFLRWAEHYEKGPNELPESPILR